MKLKVKTIVATDIVNFTAKSSLLTSNKLNNLLKKHDEIIKNVESFGWKIVKNVWDGYLLFFDTPSNALNAIKNILNQLNEYNSKIEDELEKIRVRIAVNIWEILEKNTIIWKDYFWEAINLTYRLLSIAKKDQVLLTENIYLIANKWEFNIEYIGNKSFKWIWNEIKIYNFLYNKWRNEEWISKVKESENILKWEELDNITQNVDNFIFKVSAVSAILTMQPIPLLWSGYIFISIIYMSIEIAKYYKIELSKKIAYTTVSSIIWILWFEYTKSVAQIEVTKIWLPWFGWYIQAPIAFSLTYSFWKLLSYKFYNDKMGYKKDTNWIKWYFTKNKRNWIYIFNKRKNEIIEIWKKYKDEISKGFQKLKNNLDE